MLSITQIEIKKPIGESLNKKTKEVDMTIEAKLYDLNDGKTITVLEQWHQNEVLTETHGWQPVEGGEWKEIKKEKNT